MGIEAFGLRPSHPLCYAMLCYSRIPEKPPPKFGGIATSFAKMFRADFPRLCRGRKNVVKMFYFTCNHLLCSTYVQHAKTFVQMF